MKALTAHLAKKWAFYSLAVLSTVTLISFQNCSKVKFNVERNKIAVQQSCGSITMSPSNGISESTSVAFSVTPAAGITISDLNWSFTKDAVATPVYTSATNPMQTARMAQQILRSVQHVLLAKV